MRRCAAPITMCAIVTMVPFGHLAAAVGHGTLEGVVTLVAEAVPEPTLIRNTTDPEACGSNHTLEDLVVAPDNLGIRYAIVALADVPAMEVPTAAPERLVLDNVGCSFSPHASVLTVGSTIEAVNSDPILHTVHVYGALEANLSLPVEGARRTRVLDHPGMLIVKCDVHAWMQAFIRVDEHPFHAVSDSRGFWDPSHRRHSGRGVHARGMARKPRFADEAS